MDECGSVNLKIKFSGNSTCSLAQRSLVLFWSHSRIIG